MVSGYRDKGKKHEHFRSSSCCESHGSGPWPRFLVRSCRGQAGGWLLIRLIGTYICGMKKSSESWSVELRRRRRIGGRIPSLVQTITYDRMDYHKWIQYQVHRLNTRGSARPYPAKTVSFDSTTCSSATTYYPHLTTPHTETRIQRDESALANSWNIWFCFAEANSLKLWWCFAKQCIPSLC